MRMIEISTDVFAAIWAARREGEGSEDVILRRLLKVGSAEARKPSPPKVGFRDQRYGVVFAPGFEIFRTYLGQDFRAVAQDNNWLLAQTCKLYPSLNTLSGALGIKNENAWENWYYTDAEGRRLKIANLRDGSKVARRKRLKARTYPPLDLTGIDI